MKNIKSTQYLFIAFLTFTLLFTSLPVHASKLIENNNISILANGTKWIYKVENGLLYRRLFNYTTGEWIGDWELVP